jgi:hypothetical protein
MPLDTTPATWTAGEIPTAGKLNTEIRDALTNLQAAWVDYVPVWTSAGSTLGNGILNGSYTRVGNTVDFQIFWQAGTTTTYGAPTWQFSLPLGCVTPSPLFMGVCRDASPITYYPLYGRGFASGVTCQIGTTGAAMANLTSTAPFTWAVSDQISISGSYETT